MPEEEDEDEEELAWVNCLEVVVGSTKVCKAFSQTNPSPNPYLASVPHTSVCAAAVVVSAVAGFAYQTDRMLCPFLFNAEKRLTRILVVVGAAIKNQLED